MTFPGTTTLVTVFTIVFIILLALIVSLVLFTAAKSVLRRLKGGNLPLLVVNARVASLRSEGERHFVAFEFPNGQPVEFEMSEKEIGALAQGDAGRLTFQGERFVSFKKFTDMQGTP
jgi:hypothetical protein